MDAGGLMLAYALNRGEGYGNRVPTVGANMSLSGNTRPSFLANEHCAYAACGAGVQRPRANEPQRAP